MLFKLTFNKPAYSMFFQGEDAKGVRIRVQEGVALFKPVQSLEGTDIAPIQERNRGGIEAMIEGHMSETILNALKNPNGNPFFMLERAPKGWFYARPFDGSKREPSRFQAQVRVWSRDAVRPLSTQVVHDLQGMGSTEFLKEVVNAKSIIDGYDSMKKPGRPPKEVSDARDLIKVFEDVARQVLPLDDIRHANRLINRFLGVDTTDPDKAQEQLVETPPELEAMADTPPAPSPRPRGRPPKSAASPAPTKAAATKQAAPEPTLVADEPQSAPHAGPSRRRRLQRTRQHEHA